MREATARGWPRRSAHGGLNRATGASVRSGQGVRAWVATGFGLMAALFFVNTALLMWHVDGGDIYASIRLRMAELRDQVPAWADQRLPQMVTDKPAWRNSDVEPPLGSFGHGLRGPDHDSARGDKSEADMLADVANSAQEAGRQDQNPHQGSKNGLPRAQAASFHARHSPRANGAAKVRKFAWSDLSGTNSFAMVDEHDKAWAELENDEVKFRFLEVSRGELRVELRDDNRKMTVLLLPRHSLFKFDGGEYNDLYTGYWTHWNGNRMRPDRGNYGDRKPPPTHIEGAQNSQTIAVMLAAFRDPLCGNTLYEAFSNAKYPERIIGIVIEQNHEKDVYNCVEDYCQILADQDKNARCRRNQVRVDSVPLDRARGVMPARYRQNLLLQDEEFCLQIDSHSAFETNWDVIAIEDWLLTENEMAVITAYPNMVRDRHDQRNSPQRCSTKFSGDKEVVHGGNSAINVHPGKAPYLIPFFGAGTSFSKCHANFNVPYDPYMSYLFGGEEFNRAVRLFTSGYDMYGPKRNFVYHYYDQEKKPLQGREARHREFASLSTKQKQTMSSQTTARWRTILGLPLTSRNPRVSVAGMQDASLFGLGTRRPIEQYEAFSHVNLREGTEQSRCGDLGSMKWEAYEFELPFYPAGKNCPYFRMKDIRKYCCTTLQRVLASTQDFLRKTNDMVGAEVSLSPDAKLLDPLTPVLTESNTAASLGSCASLGTPAPWPAKRDREQEDEIAGRDAEKQKGKGKEEVADMQKLFKSEPDSGPAPSKHAIREDNEIQQRLQFQMPDVRSLNDLSARQKEHSDHVQNSNLGAINSIAVDDDDDSSYVEEILKEQEKEEEEDDVDLDESEDMGVDDDDDDDDDDDGDDEEEEEDIDDEELVEVEEDERADAEDAAHSAQLVGKNQDDQEELDELDDSIELRSHIA